MEAASTVESTAERTDVQVDWRSQVLEAQRGSSYVAWLYSRFPPFLYELTGRWAETEARRLVIEMAAVRDGEAVLEVATGTGVQFVALVERNPSGRTVGIELANGMLAESMRRLGVARGRNERLCKADIELLKGDARDLPFEDESFDLIVNSFMLDLMRRDDIPRTLAEFKRVLKPGGRLILTDMTKGVERRHKLWDWLYERGVPITANCRGVLTAPVLHELGFTEIRRKYFTQRLVPQEIVTATKPS